MWIMCEHIGIGEFVVGLERYQKKLPNIQYPIVTVLATTDTNTQYQYRYQCLTQQCIYLEAKCTALSITSSLVK